MPVVACALSLPLFGTLRSSTQQLSTLPPAVLPSCLPSFLPSLHSLPPPLPPRARYEDDGVTRLALAADPAKQAWQKTTIDVAAPLHFVAGKGPGFVAGNVTVSVGAAAGNGYVGALPTRKWHFNVRCAHPPLEVVLKAGGAGEESLLTAAGSVAQLDLLDAQGKGGWYHDRNVQAGAGGLLIVRTPSMAARGAFTVVLSAGVAFRHIVAEACDTVKHHQRLPQLFDYDATAQRITLRPTPPLSAPLSSLAAGMVCVLLFTVTSYANLAHKLTRSP